MSHIVTTVRRRKAIKPPRWNRFSSMGNSTSLKNIDAQSLTATKQIISTVVISI